MKKLIGKVVYFNKQKCFGFLELKVTAPEGGVYLKKLYFHLSRVSYLQVSDSDIKAGCGAVFEESTKPPHKPQDAPFATHIEIFQDEATARAAFERYELIRTGGAQ